MEIGITLAPYAEDGVLYVTGRYPTASGIVKCYKCPKCGHSEDLEDNQ